MRIEIIQDFDYVHAIKFLESRHNAVIENPENEAIILTSHPRVITMGKRTEPSEVLIERWSRLFEGVGLYFSPRGGGATFHYPGQEVIYPVLSLERRGVSVHRYIEIMAESARVVLEGMGVHSCWDPLHPGLYVQKRKIASIGLRISRGVTSHGMSINIMADPGGFGMIYPCKAPGLEVVSFQEVTGDIPVRWSVAQAVARELVTRLDKSG